MHVVKAGGGFLSQLEKKSDLVPREDRGRGRVVNSGSVALEAICLIFWIQSPRVERSEMSRFHDPLFEGCACVWVVFFD